MILQQLRWSYGHLRQMRSMQKAVQLSNCIQCEKFSLLYIIRVWTSFFKKMLWYNVICHVFKVDIKICLNYFIKEIEFAIVYSLSIHYLECCMMSVCNRKVTTLFLAFTAS